MTVVALAVGGYISCQLYMAGKINPSVLTEKYPLLRKFHSLLLNRLYIDVFYYKVAKYTINLSRLLYKGIEMEGIRRPRIRGINEFFDIALKWMILLSQWVYPVVELRMFEAFNQKLVAQVTKLSEKVRDTQTGILSYNMLMMLAGLATLFVIILIFGGYFGEVVS